MTIFNLTTDVAGLTGVTPRITYLYCDDSYSTITAAGYLNSYASSPLGISPTDYVFASYNSATAPLFGIFIPSISANVVTLVPYVGSAVLAGATAGHVPSFANSTGLLQDSGIAAGEVLFTTFSGPDAASNLIWFDVTCGQAALASGGSVTLYASSGTKQYKVRNLQINRGGTNFSGGGGDRLGQVTDGTTVYTVVPAASLQTLANAVWGSTAVPVAASAANNTSTAAGASLVFKYSGGTTDYTAGSVVISGCLQRVA